jgi:hypothetical protein
MPVTLVRWLVAITAVLVVIAIVFLVVVDYTDGNSP